jgi:hypothetical protein
MGQSVPKDSRCYSRAVVQTGPAFVVSCSLCLALTSFGCDEGPSDRTTDDGGGSDFWLTDAPGGDGAADALAPQPDGPAIDPTKDTDSDGLPDGFEQLHAGFDPTKEDTDGDKIHDGFEDEDKDGLSAQQEWAAWQLSPTQWQKPSPRHKDLLVELDYQKGFGPGAKVLSEAIEAFAAVPLTNPDGKPGIALHIYIDEKDLPVVAMQESLDARLNYLGAHGPTFGSTAKHVKEMVHVIFASTRPGNASRGGDTIGSSSQSVEKAGVLIYPGNLQKIFPTCTNPNPPKVSVEEATIATFVHELGHTLQLGHDTTAGGGINPYNIMATDLGKCDALKKRTRGSGNANPALGATAAKGGPRFSKAAAALMKLSSKISVEAKELVNGSGYPM